MTVLDAAASRPATTAASWPASLLGMIAAAVLYTALATGDATIASVPLKLPVVLAAVLWWFLVRVRREQAPLPRGTALVLLAAVGVPLFGLAVAVLRSSAHDPTQRFGLHFGLQESSRFIYVLLYLPLSDLMRSGPRGWHDGIWIGPVLALVALTVGLTVAGGLGAHFKAGSLGPFKGSLGVDVDGTFRAFLITDVLFLPAITRLVGCLWLAGGSVRRWAMLAAVLIGTYLSHTRGLWVGTCLALGISVLLVCLWQLPVVARRVIGTIVASGLLLGLLLSADPALGGQLAHEVLGRQDLSNSLRFEQAPQLLAGARLHIVLGSGLGATLPDGYVRSVSSPWSFELSFLQLLFQLGIVGIALLALLPVSVAGRAVTRAPPDRDHRISLGFGVGALVGLLYVAAGNPFLLTSVGMLALALILAQIETPMAQTGNSLI